MVVEKEFIRLAEERRRALGWPIEQLAARAEISDRQYRNYLSGSAQPMIGTAMRLSAALGLDLNALRDRQVPDEFGCYLKPERHKENDRRHPACTSPSSTGKAASSARSSSK